MSLPDAPKIPNPTDASPDELQRITVVTQDAVNTLSRVLGREHEGLHQVAHETGERIDQLSSRVSQTTAPAEEKIKGGSEKKPIPELPSAPPWEGKQLETQPKTQTQPGVPTEQNPRRRDNFDRTQSDRKAHHQMPTPSSGTHTSSETQQRDQTADLLRDLTASVSQLQRQMMERNVREPGGGEGNNERMDRQRNRVKVARPPVYTGQVGRAGMDPLEDWIYALDMYFRALEITDPHLRAEYACSMMREKAAAWSRTSQRKRLERGEIPWDWTRLVSELRRQFGRLNPAKDSRIQLERLKQRDPSVRSLREYISNFMSLAVGLADASEAELLHRFTGGLQPDPCYELIRANVDTIEEATRVMENYAMALDATHMQLHGRAFKSTKPNPTVSNHRGGKMRNKPPVEPWKAYQFQAEKGKRIQFPITVKSMGHFLALIEKGLERTWIREKLKNKLTELEEGSGQGNAGMQQSTAQETLLHGEDAWDSEEEWIDLPAEGSAAAGAGVRAAQTDWEVNSFQSSEDEGVNLIDLNMVRVENEEPRGMKAGMGGNLLMTICCKVGNGLDAVALLDTGASVNIVGGILFKRLKSKGAVLLPQNKTLKGIGGIKVNVEGETVLPIKIGKMFAELVFLVVSQEPHLILGKTGMASLGMILDPATDTIIHKGSWEAWECQGENNHEVKPVNEPIPCEKTKRKIWQVKLSANAFPPVHREAGKYEIKLPYDILMPPKQTMSVKTGLHYRFPVGLIGRIEGKASLVSQQLSLQAGVMPQQGEIKFLLHNAGVKACKLHRGQRCAVVIMQRGMTPPMLVQRLDEGEGVENNYQMMVKTIRGIPEKEMVPKSMNMHELTIKLTQPIERKFWPRQEPQGVIIPLGRSLVLGLSEGKKVLLPFKFDYPPQGVRDCLNVKARAWMKWLPNGTSWILLHNLSGEPLQLTPSMRVIWIPGVKLQLQGMEGECLTKATSVPQEVLEVQRVPLITIAELEKEFPRCFNQDFTLTAKMKKVTVGLDDVLWKSRKVWHSCAYQQPISAVQEQVVEKELMDLENKGILERVPVETKLFISQLLVIPKGTGGCRITLDLRRLNSMCIPWSSPLPGRRSLLAKVPKEWHYLAKIDLAHGFYNIPVSPQLARMFAFVFKQQKYILKRLAMGWVNSPALFHSLVSGALSDLPVVVYLDDLLIGGKDEQEHNEAVRKVMGRLELWGFKVKPTKMDIGRRTVEFLGYQIKDGKFTVKPAVFRTLHQLPTISSLKTLRQAIGVLNLLQEVVPAFSAEMKPLYEGLKNVGKPKDWTRIQEQFKGIVSRCLGKVYCLTSVDPHSDHFEIFCDWSSRGLGFVLWQIDAAGARRLLQFGSRQNPVWRRATSSLLGELYALVWCLKSTSWITRGSQQIVIYTDSNNIVTKLKDLKKLVKEPDIRCLRLIGFLLSNYSLGKGLQLKFISTEDNTIADLLSRWGFTEVVEAHPWSPACLEKEESGLEFRSKGLAAMERSAYHVSANDWLRLHEGHFGLPTVMHRSKVLGISITAKEAGEKLANCRICQAFQSLRRDTKLAPLLTVDQPNQALALDYIGPVNRIYILVMKDLFSKEVMLRVTRNCAAVEGIQAVETWKRRHSWQQYPRVLQVDKAGGFNAHSFRAWADQKGMRVVYAHAYDHRSHGAVERANQTVIKTIGKMSLESNAGWWLSVRAAQDAINSAFNRAIGMSPQQCAQGDEAVWRQTRERRELMNQEMNKNRRDPSLQYQSGDLVWMYKLSQKQRGRLGKFEPPWDGPLSIVDRQSKSSYRVRNRGGRVFQIHADFLRPYHQ